MAVYVDNMQMPWRGMIMSHMTADTNDELHAMADVLGLKRSWFQGLPDHSIEHYDVSEGKRQMALLLGAIEEDIFAEDRRERHRARRRLTRMTQTMMLHGNHELLNFVQSPIQMPNFYGLEFPSFTYKTVEHYFQSAKALFIIEKDGRTFEEAHDYIAQADDAHGAKKRGREIKIDTVAWDAAAMGFMLMGHTAKFTQILIYQRALMKTGKKFLIEHRPDPIWGDNMDGSGKNLCGKSLMIVRDRLLT